MRVDGYDSDSETDFGSEDGQDYWEVGAKYATKHHKKPRQCLYTPNAEMQEHILAQRSMELQYLLFIKSEGSMVDHLNS